MKILCWTEIICQRRASGVMSDWFCHAGSEDGAGSGGNSSDRSRVPHAAQGWGVG